MACKGNEELLTNTQQSGLSTAADLPATNTTAEEDTEKELGEDKQIAYYELCGFYDQHESPLLLLFFCLETSLLTSQTHW